MKRTAATLFMLAGLGGCASTDSQLPNEPTIGRGQMPSDAPVRQTANFTGATGGGVASYGSSYGGAGCAAGDCGYGASPYGATGPMGHGLGQYLGHGGVLPAPGMGPAGAVAAIGAYGTPSGPGGPGSGIYGGVYANQRTEIRFSNPPGMRVTWQGPGGSFVEPAALVSPGRYNFPQGNIYRLRLSSIPALPGDVFYPTLEVYPSTQDTVTFLSHAAVPVAFTIDDFAQAKAGNMVVKVIYMPFPRFQDLATIAAADEIVSTLLEPGLDPVEEANRLGTILAVIRMGNADLEDPNTPALDAPPAYVPTMSSSGPAMPGMLAPNLSSKDDKADDATPDSSLITVPVLK